MSNCWKQEKHTFWIRGRSTWGVRIQDTSNKWRCRTTYNLRQEGCKGSGPIQAMPKSIRATNLLEETNKREWGYEWQLKHKTTYFLKRKIWAKGSGYKQQLEAQTTYSLHREKSMWRSWDTMNNWKHTITYFLGNGEACEVVRIQADSWKHNTT